jgi:hypothetical protein
MFIINVSRAYLEYGNGVAISDARMLISLEVKIIYNTSFGSEEQNFYDNL